MDFEIEDMNDPFDIQPACYGTRLVNGRSHTTRDGQHMSLLDMQNSHLNNTILLILRKAVSKRKEVDLFEANKSNSAFKAKLRGTRQLDPEQAADEINQYVLLSGVYTTEAIRRGMDTSAYQSLLAEIYAD